jgi:hypothetical protein
MPKAEQQKELEPGGYGYRQQYRPEHQEFGFRNDYPD